MYCMTRLINVSCKIAVEKNINYFANFVFVFFTHMVQEDVYLLLVSIAGI